MILNWVREMLSFIRVDPAHFITLMFNSSMLLLRVGVESRGVVYQVQGA